MSKRKKEKRYLSVVFPPTKEGTEELGKFCRHKYTCDSILAGIIITSMAYVVGKLCSQEKEGR